MEEFDINTDRDEGVGRRALIGLGAAASAVSGMAFKVDASESPDITSWQARALSQAIHSRKVSCVEVMTAYLDRIERLNPRANAIVALQDRDGLLREAKDRDVQIARGDVIGPLHGFPHAVKDLQPVKGIPFTRGSPLYKDYIAPADNLQVGRLRASGVIFIGKTNTPEFGLGSHTVNRVYGATHNSYDPSRTAGGSSGGAAVAVAQRMLPVADGSDYGGSLRNPAGWNNVCGFRTSFGRVPVDGADIWTPSMSVVGPLARNVSDLSLLLSVQAGYDPRAPLSMESSGDIFRTAPPPKLKGARIGWLGDMGGAVPYEAGILDLCRNALTHFEDLGCVVEETTPEFDVEAAWQAFIKLRAWQSSAQFLPFNDDPAKRGLLNAQSHYELDTALRLSALDVIGASVVRTQWTTAMTRLLARYDYLVSPTAQLFPFPIETVWPTEVGGVAMRSYHEWMKGVCLVTLSGCPSLAMPAGFDSRGLPMGIQIIGPVHQEMACLQLGAAFEAVNPLWRTRPPPRV